MSVEVTARPRRNRCAGLLSCLALAASLATALAACEVPGATVSTSATEPAGSALLLDELNARARGRDDWFEAFIAERAALAERYDGELDPALAAYLEADVYVFDDSEVTAYLADVVGRLIEAWEGPPLDVRVTVVSDTRFNAHVDAAASLHVSTGLLRGLENEDQLAAVLAHELAHLLLRHPVRKAGAERLGERAMTFGRTLFALGRNARPERDDTVLAERRLQDAGRMGGLLWTDLLVPSRSRKEELEADRLGFDLVVGAGYNYAEFDDVLARLQGAALRRSERIALLDRIARERLEAERIEASASFGEDNAEDLARIAEKLLERAGRIADTKSATHPLSVERIGAVRVYLRDVHGDDALPPASSFERFRRAIRTGDAGAPLQRDLAAVKAVIALAENDEGTANRMLAEAVATDDVSERALAIRVARSALELASRRYDAARTALEQLALDPRAPVEAYLQLAQVQAYHGDVDAGLGTLELGARRIGRDYRFLPIRIHIEKEAGREEAAAASTEACARYDKGRARRSLEALAGVSTDEANSYYRRCVALLGYDPVAERMAKTRERVEGAVRRGCELLSGLGIGGNCRD